jgi:hypothetical protein
VKRDALQHTYEGVNPGFLWLEGASEATESSVFSSHPHPSEHTPTLTTLIASLNRDLLDLATGELVLSWQIGNRTHDFILWIVHIYT